MVITCQCFNCIPIKSITWQKVNGSVITNSENILIQNTATDYEFSSDLIIHNLTEMDAGYYECEMKNLAGESKQMFELVVQSPPKINEVLMKIGDLEVEVSETISIPEYSSVEMFCVTTGNPKPTVNWYKNYEFEGESESKQFWSIDKNDSGVYECEATNKIGVTRKTFYLDVQFAPQNDNEVLNSTTVVTEGENVSFKCSVIANPEPDVHWIHNSIDLAASSRFENEVTNNASVLSFIASSIDSGVFTCIANNTLGVSSRSFYLVVHSKFNEKC